MLVNVTLLPCYSRSPLLAVFILETVSSKQDFKKNHRVPGLITGAGPCKRRANSRCFLPPENPSPGTEWAPLRQLWSLGTSPVTVSQGPFEHLLMPLLFPSRNPTEREEVEDPSLNPQLCLEIFFGWVNPHNPRRPQLLLFLFSPSVSKPF